MANNPLDLYPNLPGMLAEFKDGGLQLREDLTPAATDSVLILGTAIDGPIMEPIAVDSVSRSQIFGAASMPNTNLSNGTTLPLGFEETYQNGARDVRMMRVTGANAELNLNASEISDNEYQIQTDVFSEELVNGNVENAFVLDYEVSAGMEDEIEVYANGVAVPEESYSYTVEGEDPTVTLLADTVDSDADVYIRYTRVLTEEQEIENEALVTSDDTLFQFANTPVKEDSISLFLDGIEVDLNTVTIDYGDGTILFTEAQVGTVTADYTWLDSSDILETQTIDAGTGEAFIAAGDVQQFNLTNDVEIDYADLFVTYNDGQFLADEAYRLNDEDNGIFELLSGFVPMGAVISVRYAYALAVDKTPYIKLESYFGGAVYNEGFVTVRNKQGMTGEIEVVLQKPLSKRAVSSEEPLIYGSDQYPNLLLLEQIINEDMRNNVYKAELNQQFRNIPTNTLSLGTFEFTGGDDGVGLSKERMYKALHDAYVLLENYNVDYIVPLGVFADDELTDPNKNFAEQLGLACAVISRRENVVQGVIATKSPDYIGLQNIKSYVEHLSDLENRYVMKDKAGNELHDAEGNPFDLGRYLYVLAGPDRVFNHARIGSYTANSAAAFAGELAQMYPFESGINREVESDLGLRFTFSNTQRNAIVGNRFIVYKTKNQGMIGREATAIEDEMTAAPSDSDYASGSVTRQVKFVVNRLRQVVEPFIGAAPSVNNQNALATAIDKVMEDEFISGGILMPGSTFKLNATLYQRTLGESDLNLELIPAIVRRRINLIVSLGAGQ